MKVPTAVSTRWAQASVVGTCWLVAHTVHAADATTVTLPHIARQFFEQGTTRQQLNQLQAQARGRLQVARAAFSVVLSTDARWSATQYGSRRATTALESTHSAAATAYPRRLVASAAATKNTRYGVTFSLISAALFDPSANRDRLHGYDGVVRVDVPLLKPMLRNSLLLRELAAESDLEGARLRAQGRTAEALWAMVVAYWQWVAAYKVSGIALDEERRARRLLAEADALIAGNELPRAERASYEANVARATARRLEAEHKLQAAQTATFLVAGLPAPEAGANVPADPLPSLPPRLRIDGGVIAGMVQAALERRGDYNHLAAACEAQGLRTDAYAVDRNPDIGSYVEFGVQYRNAGLLEGPQGAQDWACAGYVGIAAGLSMQSREAEGKYQEQLARQRECRLSLHQLRNEISARVTDRVIEAERIARALFERQRAAVQYEAAVDNEQEKQRLGMGTTIDILTAEERYVQALRDLVHDSAAYAGALAALRYEIGDMDAIARSGEGIDMLKRPPDGLFEGNWGSQ